MNVILKGASALKMPRGRSQYLRRFYHRAGNRNNTHPQLAECSYHTFIITDAAHQTLSTTEPYIRQAKFELRVIMPCNDKPQYEKTVSFERILFHNNASVNNQPAFAHRTKLHEVGRANDWSGSAKIAQLYHCTRGKLSAEATGALDLNTFLASLNRCLLDWQNSRYASSTEVELSADSKFPSCNFSAAGDLSHDIKKEAESTRWADIRTSLEWRRRRQRSSSPSSSTTTATTSSSSSSSTSSSSSSSSSLPPGPPRPHPRPPPHPPPPPPPFLAFSSTFSSSSLLLLLLLHLLLLLLFFLSFLLLLLLLLLLPPPPPPPPPPPSSPTSYPLTSLPCSTCRYAFTHTHAHTYTHTHANTHSCTDTYTCTH